MTLLLDPPRWPAHGTLWSHLVSDASLQELRLFARNQGLPDRGLDLDHYDVPAGRYDELVAAGAVPVAGGELARRLAASDVRVPGRERRRATRAALLERWTLLWADGTHDSRAREAVAAVGEDLVDRWREPHRVYHSRLHLADALDALDVLAGAETPRLPDAVWHARVALWFHDAVHDGGHAGAAGRDEQRSAQLARALLGPLVDVADIGADAGGPAGTRLLTQDDVDEVARLVLETTHHGPEPDDVAGGLVSDADLAILGAQPARYRRYVQQVRAEYADVPDPAFRAGRTAVLEQLLAQPALFRTDTAARAWAARAEGNLRGELEDLRRPAPGSVG